MTAAYSMKLSVTHLKALLVHLDKEFGQAILEGVADISFPAIGRPPDNRHFDDRFDLTLWERGRAFGERLELRWRRREEQFVTLLMTDAPLSLPSGVAGEVGALPEPTSLELVETKVPLQVILWGEWQDPKEETELPDPTRPYWYEQRIPRFLAYPWNGHAKRLAIEVASYRVLPGDPEGRPDFSGDVVYRFVKVVEASVSPPEKRPTVAEPLEEEHDDQPV